MNLHEGIRDYRTSHVGPGSCSDAYDEKLFAPGTYDDRVWQEEKQLLERLLEQWVPVRERYLDFACGTGRILAHLEPHFRTSVGLDISASMLSEAERKVKAASLICGDATRSPELIPDSFDCITAWRFFLNAQPALREEAMRVLAGRLRNADSVLMFNIHGNRASTRRIMVALDKLRGRRNSTMSLDEVARLVSRHGLRIVDWHGIMCLDKSFYNYLPRKLWTLLESALRATRFPKRWSVYLVFVCRRA